MFVGVCCILVSLSFIYLEFFFPGAILGIVGGIGLGLSIWFFLWQSDHLFLSLSVICLIGIALGFTVQCALWRLKKIAIFFPKQTQAGYVAASFNETLIGEIGVAASDLKPSGYILVKGEKYGALSEGNYIKKGAPIKVLKGQGGYFIVQSFEVE